MDTLQQIAKGLEERYNKALELKDDRKRAKEFLVIAATAIGLIKTIESVPSSQEKLTAYADTLGDYAYDIVIKHAKGKPDTIFGKEELYRSLDGAILALRDVGYHTVYESMNTTGTVWTAKLTNEEDGEYIYINRRRLKL